MGSPFRTSPVLETRAHQQEIITNLGTQALENDDYEQLLEEAITALTASLETDLCHVLESRSDDEQLFLRDGVGWDDGLVGNTNVSIAATSQFGYTLRSDDPVIVTDFGTESRFSAPSLLDEHDVVSGICVTLGPADDPWGVLGTHATEKRHFSERDALFVENVASILTSALDATQATRNRDDRPSKERILETSPVGITFVDADGMIDFANDHAEQIFGESVDRLPPCVHDDSWNFADRNGNAVSNDEIPFSRAKQTGEPVTEEVLGITQPDNTRVWLSVQCTPLFDEDGTFDGTTCALTDVTDRKRLEGKLEEILGRVDDAFCAFDDELRYTFVNERAEELLQHSEAELLGNALWEMFPGATDEADVRESFETAIETQEPTSYEHYYEPLGNWIEGNIYPSETGVSLYFRDITERKKYERKLEQSNERLEQFAYAASHDLQEPLRMVTSYLDLIERRYDEDLDEDGQEFLEFAVDGAERMREMIDGLLQYSRIETQGDPFDLVDLNDVLADVQRDLRVQIEESDAEITADSLPCVQGDGNQLRQVFQNLLSNAIEYSGPQPPRIDISVQRDGGKWIISVRDEGIGIDPTNEDRIFQVFKRFHTSGEQVGSGIGLALCKRIVERHGGRISVDSTPGAGSTFTFTLPATTDHTT